MKSPLDIAAQVLQKLLVFPIKNRLAKTGQGAVGRDVIGDRENINAPASQISLVELRIIKVSGQA